MPSSPSRRDRLADLIVRPFAHRGLHGAGVIENSRAAFRAAIAAGHGIELDVQATADGEAMVFHDYELSRLTESEGKLAEMPAAAIAEFRLKGTDEGAPTLPEILGLIGGRTPLLIEVKSPGRRVDTLCRAVKRAVDPYIGPVAVMSFNPAVPRWFSVHAPDVLRGLVVTEEGKPDRGHLRRQLAAWCARPDFFAWDIRDLPSRFAAGQRERGRPTLTWTCRSDDQRATAAAHADQIIYEVPA